MPSRPPRHNTAVATAPHRPARDDQFYSLSRWRRLRSIKLGRDPLCSQCAEQGRTTPAGDVHHVIPRRARPDLAYALSNLESLCHACHSTRTRAEKRNETLRA
jgi:5-methylcytosine-specific restriction protein A